MLTYAEQVVTVGLAHVKFWTINGSMLTYAHGCSRMLTYAEQVVTVGLAHVKFWTINGRLLRGRSGSFTQVC
jgi:hypothetical protein